MSLINADAESQSDMKEALTKQPTEIRIFQYGGEHYKLDYALKLYLNDRY